ncbi:MAG: hypothetical protein DF168_01072 [Candidatus Moanabacter tarae]|uniref:Uncharacterized protein n=1 Tax=Candidatus Moanibacter tarae TaxID=2200854 RepID=A0A2Z4AEJ5_9BACT|nr:MAG: hypothetical protein DF168_01072 [Candidatus Moanabacter tarae]
MGLASLESIKAIVFEGSGIFYEWHWGIDDIRQFILAVNMPDGSCSSNSSDT